MIHICYRSGMRPVAHILPIRNRIPVLLVNRFNSILQSSTYDAGNKSSTNGLDPINTKSVMGENVEDSPSSSIKQLYEMNKSRRDENVHIISKPSETAEQKFESMKQARIEKIERNIENLATPKQMKSYLDQYIIGQDECKKIMSVAIYNHYLRVNDNLIRRLKKSSFKRGNTGVAISQTCDSKTGIPGSEERAKLALEFSKGSSSKEAPKLDKTNLILIGPSGSGKTLMAKTIARILNVPIVIQDCTSLTQAGYIGEDIADCVQKLFNRSGRNVEECERGIVVLDEVDKLAHKVDVSSSKDISGEGVQQSLLKLIEGSQVPVHGNIKKNTAFAHTDPDEDEKVIDTSNVLFIAMGAFVGLDRIIAKRLTLEQSDSEDQNDGDSNVHDHAPGTKESMKPSSLNRVIPGDIIKFGMIPEFIGRLPIIATLKNLTAEDLERVLVTPKNSIIQQYRYTFSKLGIELAVTGPALQSVAQLSLKNGTGARGLHSILSKLLLSANYDCPGSNIAFVLINKEVIESFSRSWLSGKSLETFKAKYFLSGEKKEFMNCIHKEDPILENKLLYHLI